MADSIVNARIQLKNDTEAHWNQATNFIPRQGEIIIYSADINFPFPRLKIGNGVTNVIALPFIDADTLNGKSIIIHTTTEWGLLYDYVGTPGTIMLYTDYTTIEENNETKIVPGIKIGDGSTPVIDLPFIGEDIMNQLITHINDATRHITAQERSKWNNKLNCEDTINSHNLILNRN